MPGTVSFVVDTNLFHECLSLDASAFPWADVGEFDSIELIVTDPVQTELDEHKKDTRPRIKRRAIEAVRWFREMLRSGTNEHVLREAAPRVIMTISAQTAYRDHPEFLDMAVPDDRIVGVAVALAKADPNRDIRLLSSDTRPLAKANAVGLQFKFIPESWIREPEIDEQQKEIARLTAQNAKLKALHPNLVVKALDAPNNRLALTRTMYSEPSEDEKLLVRNAILERFSVSKVEKTFPDTSMSRRPILLASNRIVHTPPSERSVRRYRDETYQAWVAACVAHISTLAHTVNGRMPTSTVTICLSNIGYRSAENVRIHFKARGPFLLAPSRVEVYGREAEDLPPVPRPPSGEWHHDGVQLATASAMRLPLFAPPPDYSRFGRDAFVKEDEEWYYAPDAPEAPVDAFTLESRRFRHGADSEFFEFLVFPQSIDVELRGAIAVEVSASNVADALALTFPIAVQTTFISPLDMMLAFLDSQNPLAQDPE
jgi:hypothetical protein